MFVTHRASTQHAEVGLSMDEALAATNHPCSAPTLYRRAARSRSTRTEPETITIPENGSTDIINCEDRPPPDIVLRRGGSSSINGEASSAMSSLSPSRSPPASNLRRSKRKRCPTNPNILTAEQSTMEDSTTTPASSEVEAATTALNNRKMPKLTAYQANHNLFAVRVKSLSDQEKYKRALKEATTLVKRGEMGRRKAVRLMNERYQLTRKSERLLTKSTVSDYVAKGLIGSSPQKRGPLPKLPKDFNMLLNAHIEMKQLEGVQESKPRHIKALIGAAVRDTDRDSMSRDYLYRRFRKEMCATVAPTKPMQMEERRGLWTTYNNLNDWFNGAKKIMIDLGFAEDKPMRVVDIFRGRESEMPCEIDRKSIRYCVFYPPLCH